MALFSLHHCFQVLVSAVYPYISANFKRFLSLDRLTREPRPSSGQAQFRKCFCTLQPLHLNATFKRQPSEPWEMTAFHPQHVYCHVHISGEYELSFNTEVTTFKQILMKICIVTHSFMFFFRFFKTTKHQKSPDGTC